MSTENTTSPTLVMAGGTMPWESREARGRAIRPGYFKRLDALIASGAVAIEDRRLSHTPTGRTYAD